MVKKYIYRHRDTQQKSIEWYNYAGDQLVRNFSYRCGKLPIRRRMRGRISLFCFRTFEWSHLFADVHDVKVMVGSQYNMKEYEYTLYSR